MKCMRIITFTFVFVLNKSPHHIMMFSSEAVGSRGISIVIDLRNKHFFAPLFYLLPPSAPMVVISISPRLFVTCRLHC